MANKFLTVFQNLDKAISGNWDANNQSPIQHTNNYDMSNSKILYKTDNKADYNKTKLELQQNNYLNNRWKKANMDLSVTAFSGLNNVKLMYRDADLMDSFPEIGAALDIVSEESSITDSKGKIINVYSTSDRIKSIIEDLLINRLDLQVTAPMVIRSMCKYGNQFMLLNIDNKLGITGWRQLPVFEVERIENGILNPYGGTMGMASTLDNADLSTKFVWLGEQNSQVPFRNWQIGHFRLLTDSLYLPYGVSYLNKARRHWRMLSLMEDMMLIYRLERSIERRVYKIFVGAIDDADVQAYVEEIANNFKRTPIVDPLTGQVDLRKNLLPVRKDTPIPLLDGRTITIEDLAKEYEDGKINYVYSVQDNTKQIVPGKVVWCGKNYTAEELVKITLDDGSYTVMAKEHEVVMRDGSKKRADELSPNESLMPFYTTKNPSSKIWLEKYEKVYNPNSSKYEYTHRLIGANIKKDDEGYNTIHHKDFNKYNNTPSNLLWCDFFEHRDFHKQFGSQHIARYNKLPESIEERRLRGLKLGYRDDFKAYNESELHTQHNSIRKEATKKSWVGDGRTNRIEKMNIHFDNLIWDSLRENILNKTIVNRKTMLEYINSNLIEHLMSINCNRRLNNNGFISREVLENRIKDNGFKTITEYISETLRNHKVAKIEYIGGDDVYCMTVVGDNGEDDRHNFALKTFNEDGSWHENGIFVSNCIDQDIFIPVRDPNASTPIDTLPAAQNLTAMDDIKFIQNKVLTALRIPKTFLNFEDSVGDGKNLALMDIRFTRTVNRIQQAFLMELTKIVSIHLYLLGFDDELTNFSLSMNNPSTQSEQLEIDNLQKKILAVRDAVSDPGNGIPIMSQTRALREIMKWSDKEIKENLEEIRLEKGIAAELEKTSQIIKKTGVFDIVDRMYGETGAEYEDDPASPQGDDNSGMSGGGGGGFGGGLDDMGGIDDETMDGDVSGEEGEIPVEDANVDDSSNEPTNEPQTSNESIKKRKPLLTEHRKTNKKTNKKYDTYMTEYLNHIKKHSVKEDDVFRTDIYDKSLIINEDFNGIIKSIDAFLD